MDSKLKESTSVRIRRLEDQRNYLLGVMTRMVCQQQGSEHPAVAAETRKEWLALASQPDGNVDHTGTRVGDLRNYGVEK